MSFAPRAPRRVARGHARVRVTHALLRRVLSSPEAEKPPPPVREVLLFRDGRHEATLAPGAYALWKGAARAKVVPVDLREQVVDV